MKQVSFRGLVGNDDSKRSSHTTSSGGDDDEEASSLASSSSQKTPSLSLGERLLRTHKHRDPLRYYEITKVLGSGSMGSVRKVRKRTFGGSARQAFVRNEAAQNNEPSAGGGGILGRAFPCLSFCLPGNNNSETMAPSSSSLKRSKFVAFENEGTNSGQTLVSTGNDSAISALTAETKILPRSTMTGTVTTKDEKQAKYHQSKSSSSMISFGTSVSVDFALKNIILSKCTNDSYRQELLHEIAVLQSLDHPNIVSCCNCCEILNVILKLPRRSQTNDFLYHTSLTIFVDDNNTHPNAFAKRYGPLKRTITKSKCTWYSNYAMAATCTRVIPTRNDRPSALRTISWMPLPICIPRILPIVTSRYVCIYLSVVLAWVVVSVFYNATLTHINFILLFDAV